MFTFNFCVPMRLSKNFSKFFHLNFLLFLPFIYIYIHIYVCKNSVAHHRYLYGSLAEFCSLFFWFKNEICIGNTLSVKKKYYRLFICLLSSTSLTIDASFLIEFTENMFLKFL